MQEIKVSALMLKNEAGSWLTVCKYGTKMFMFPGGKPEPGESALATILREVREEISLELRVDQLQYLGQFAAAAANEADSKVVADVFLLKNRVLQAEIVPAAEIVATKWITAAESAHTDIAPLTKQLLAMLV